MKLVEKYFWAICVVVTLLGLLAPAVGAPFRPLITFLLAGILFFTGLKLDFAAAVREFRRPGLQLYVAAMVLVVLPLVAWLAARWLVPAFAVGVLIMAAMPAGMATSSLTDIVRGNAALALVVTLVSSLLCPLVVPVVIGLATGGLTEGGGAYLVRRTGFLAAILFAPLAAAWLVRRLFPALVARHREAFTGLSIVSLALLILGAMSLTSADALELLRRSPRQAVGLIVFLFGFSVVMHLIGYVMAPWRPPADKAALSITTAYVNNGLAIVFAKAFFVARFGVEAMLPSILLEVPMVLAILPVKSYLARVTSREGPPAQPAIARTV